MDDLAEIRVTLSHWAWQSTTSSPASLSDDAQRSGVQAKDLRGRKVTHSGDACRPTKESGRFSKGGGHGQ